MNVAPGSSASGMPAQASPGSGYPYPPQGQYSNGYPVSPNQGYPYTGSPNSGYGQQAPSNGFPLSPQYQNQPWFDGTYPVAPPLDNRSDAEFFYKPQQ